MSPKNPFLLQDTKIAAQQKIQVPSAENTLLLDLQKESQQAREEKLKARDKLNDTLNTLLRNNPNEFYIEDDTVETTTLTSVAPPASRSDEKDLLTSKPSSTQKESQQAREEKLKARDKLNETLNTLLRNNPNEFYIEDDTVETTTLTSFTPAASRSEKDLPTSKPSSAEVVSTTIRNSGRS